MSTSTIANIQLAATLFKRYTSVREQSIAICRPLKAEDYVVQPIQFVSPPKWHLGHTTWFFENFILIEYLPSYQLFNVKLNYFMNSYYESQGPRVLRSNRGNMSRPTVEEILEYRSYVDRHMEQLFKQSFPSTKVQDTLTQLLEIGLQHEQQHQELLVTDIKYILGHNPLYPIYIHKTPFNTLDSEPKSLQFLNIKAGLYEIGYTGEDFCWDNELSVHQYYLPEFGIADRLITNGEYLEFMDAGGYSKHEYWLSPGWEWSKAQSTKAPLYWYRIDGGWWQYTLRGLEPIRLQEPVTHINYYEADAFASWKGMRLPTEFEWEVACKQLYSEIPSSGNFVESKKFHPQAQQGPNDFQFLGNTWEWTASAYLPYPNYPRFKGALGEYNGKFMINQMVLRGGSCATPHSHTRITYRNFFHTDERWQFTGLRLAQ